MSPKGDLRSKNAWMADSVNEQRSRHRWLEKSADGENMMQGSPVAKEVATVMDGQGRKGPPGSMRATRDSFPDFIESPSQDPV